MAYSHFCLRVRGGLLTCYNPHHWPDCTFMLLLQDFEKPSPPQKPLPANPLGRSSRLGHCATAAGAHIPGSGPLPVPIPTVPRPPPSIPLPSRWVQCRLHSDMTWGLVSLLLVTWSTSIVSLGDTFLLFVRVNPLIHLIFSSLSL